MENHGIGTPAEREHILRAVAAAMSHSHPDLKGKAKRAKDGTLDEQISVLTEIERTPGLAADLFHIVALAKQALAGKKVDDFWQAIWKHEGMI